MLLNEQQQQREKKKPTKRTWHFGSCSESKHEMKVYRQSKQKKEWKLHDTTTQTHKEKEQTEMNFD